MVNNKSPIDPRSNIDDTMRTVDPTQLLKRSKLKRTKWIVLTAISATLLIVFGLWLVFFKPSDSTHTNIRSTSTEDKNIPKEIVESSHAPDHTKLPLGDGKYSTSPQKGYVYSCQTNFSGGGAFAQGPWIDKSAKTWNIDQKITVDGNKQWPNATWSTSSSGDIRTISSHDVPLGHSTGTFPISSSDDAYAYDRNPNTIREQDIVFAVPKSPISLAQPECVGGEVGIATTGVLLFNAFDAGGRDAVATEIQDSCEGHPQGGGYYHYHGYSDCFKDDAIEGSHSSLLGYAFDGFGIFGIKGEDGKELSSSDLDACHGHTHTITWDGQKVSMYHYHFTHDFPYTVSCFMGRASVKSLSTAGQQMPPRR